MKKKDQTKGKLGRWYKRIAQLKIHKHAMKECMYKLG